MGGPLDEGFKRISGHIEQAAATMHDLATAMENDNLTEEQELEVLMIQVSHYWFTQIEDEDIQEALQR
jgi:predicted P-loop ATPase